MLGGCPGVWWFTRSLWWSVGRDVPLLLCLDVRMVFSLCACCLFIPGFSFHKDTDHVGSETILMRSKISTSVVTLSLNQSCSGVLGIRTSPDQLWKAHSTHRVTIIYCYVVIVAFFFVNPFSTPQIGNLHMEKWSSCCTVQLFSCTLYDTVHIHNARHQQSREREPGRQGSLVILESIKSFGNLQPLRFHILSQRAGRQQPPQPHQMASGPQCH